jgi:hypothetical protein
MVVLTPAMKVTVDPSLEQPTTNFADVIKSTNADVYVSQHVFIYQHVSIAFGIIFRVAFQEHEEYNNLPH